MFNSVYGGFSSSSTGSGSTGTVTSVSAGTGMDFTTITTSGSVSIDTTKVIYFALGITGSPTATTILKGNGSWNTIGDITEATSSVLTISGGSNSIIGSGVTIQVKQAGAAQSGYLSSTDWNTFNNKGSGTVTSVTGTISRITSTGGA